MLKNVIQILNFLGIYPHIAYTNIKGLRWYYKDLKKVRSQLVNRNDFKVHKLHPILQDKYSDSGTLSGHYFHQDLLVAKAVFQNKPVKHVDIGSRTDGFVAHVASFREIEVFDIRPLLSDIANIKFVQTDFMLPNKDLFDYTDSISCLHAIEHFGLGRYNDPIDVNGHLKGLSTINKVLSKGGKFYFSTPIGPQRIEFNAHRVFSISYLQDLFYNDYIIDKFSYVDDSGYLHEAVTLTDELIRNNCWCNYGCGIFEMTKK